MEDEGTVSMAKRNKVYEDNEAMVEEDSAIEVAGNETDPTAANSEQMELEIANILEKINGFTQMVSELLESGKSMLNAVSDEFEERLISIHKEQMEKWQEEIKELRLLDTANEEDDGRLHSAKYLLQNIHGAT